MLTHFIASYGAFFVAVMIALECVGIPLPGETVLVATAIYAGESHDINIWEVVGAAAAGGIVGNVVAYLLGREYGYRLLIRYGSYVGLTDTRIKIGQYLFLKHGSKVVVAARFLALLRSFAGILAGANRMPWQPFLVATILGAVIWSSLYGFLAYALGDHVRQALGPVGIALGLILIAALVIGGRTLARREDQLAAEAERMFPGPLGQPRRSSGR
jgi:membrane protein DedA with SNARE-associated domain